MLSVPPHLRKAVGTNEVVVESRVALSKGKEPPGASLAEGDAGEMSQLTGRLGREVCSRVWGTEPSDGLCSGASLGRVQSG